VLVLALVLVVDGLVSQNFHAPISIQCLSSLFLNALVDGTSTTCFGNAFQHLIYLILKNDFRTVVEHKRNEMLNKQVTAKILNYCGCCICTFVS